jgi:hypothetical protein
MDRNEYLTSINGQVRRKSRKRGSKVHAKVVLIIQEMMNNKELTTITNVVLKLNKNKNYGVYVRTLIAQSDVLEFVKIHGINIIVPKEKITNE